MLKLKFCKAYNMELKWNYNETMGRFQGNLCRVSFVLLVSDQNSMIATNIQLPCVMQILDIPFFR